MADKPTLRPVNLPYDSKGNPIKGGSPKPTLSK